MLKPKVSIGWKQRHAVVERSSWHWDKHAFTPATGYTTTQDKRF